jgi:5-formyltetrahydrofolate cyclo-ligase
MQPTSKAALRTYCIEHLKRAAKRANRYGKDKRLQRRLQLLVKSLGAHRIMAYVPLDTEADITPLLHRWKRMGKEIYVPFMEGESFGLVQYKYPLKRKRFGVMEPKSGNIVKRKKIDLAIIPVVAIDGNMRRIGFGKGMYDRFFSRYGGNIGTIVFVMRTVCKSDHLFGEAHDVQGDILITGD